MKNPLPRIETAVPRTLHTQLEIVKAIRTLTGGDENDAAGRRREIADIRRDLDVLKRDFQNAGEEWLALVKAELATELEKYTPDQPRVPKGNHGGGQWASGSKAGSDASSASVLAVGESA